MEKDGKMKMQKKIEGGKAPWWWRWMLEQDVENEAMKEKGNQR